MSQYNTSYSLPYSESGRVIIADSDRETWGSRLKHCLNFLLREYILTWEILHLYTNIKLKITHFRPLQTKIPTTTRNSPLNKLCLTRDAYQSDWNSALGYHSQALYGRRSALCPSCGCQWLWDSTLLSASSQLHSGFLFKEKRQQLITNDPCFTRNWLRQLKAIQYINWEYTIKNLHKIPKPRKIPANTGSHYGNTSFPFFPRVHIPGVLFPGRTLSFWCTPSVGIWRRKVLQVVSARGSTVTTTWWTVSGTASSPLRSTHVGKCIRRSLGGRQGDTLWSDIM